jgi:hypothetical protein
MNAIGTFISRYHPVICPARYVFFCYFSTRHLHTFSFYPTRSMCPVNPMSDLGNVAYFISSGSFGAAHYVILQYFVISSLLNPVFLL